MNTKKIILLALICFLVCSTTQTYDKTVCKVMERTAKVGWSMSKIVGGSVILFFFGGGLRNSYNKAGYQWSDDLGDYNCAYPNKDATPLYRLRCMKNNRRVQLFALAATFGIGLIIDGICGVG